MNHPVNTPETALRLTQPQDAPCCVCGGPAFMQICARCAIVAPPVNPGPLTAPELAHTVVYRHPCDCSSASRPLQHGEHAEHRFDVDGQPFPWFIHEDGPRFTRAETGLFMVHVRFFPGLARGGHFGRFAHEHRKPPVIAGVVFPWVLDTSGVIYRSGRDQVPTIELTFYAEQVDADCEIPDAV